MQFKGATLLFYDMTKLVLESCWNAMVNRSNLQHNLRLKHLDLLSNKLPAITLCAQLGSWITWAALQSRRLTFDLESNSWPWLLLQHHKYKRTDFSWSTYTDITSNMCPFMQMKPSQVARASASASVSSVTFSTCQPAESLYSLFSHTKKPTWMPLSDNTLRWIRCLTRCGLTALPTWTHTQHVSLLRHRN